MPFVTASFLRLVTNARIFIQPTPIANTVSFLDALFAMPGVERPPVGAEWTILRTLCIDNGLCANAIPDAWLAATVIQMGEHLFTFDADFKKLLPRARLTVLVN